MNLIPNPVRWSDGGLQGILEHGLDLVGPNSQQQRHVSAEKLVYTI
jgi:hypothetical protein